MAENFLEEYLGEVSRISNEISRDDIERVIGLIYEAWKARRRIFIAGNGGSASTATHFASDLCKSTAVPETQRVRAFSLTDNAPLVSAITNDLGWGMAYVEQLKNLMEEGDLFIAISVHGGSGEDKAGPWSQNLLNAARYVKEKGGKVVSLVGFDGGVLRKISDASVIVPVDSTPQVEGFHLVLTHLICSRLRELIESEARE